MKNQYLYFSNRQIVGIVFLLFCVMVLLSLPYFFSKVPAPITVQELPAAESYLNIQTDVSELPDDGPVTKQLHLFAFNPNTIDSIGLMQIGLRPKIIQTLLHYRQKGGRFFKPEDIRKLWGLTTEEANALIPYIHISDVYHAKNANQLDKNLSLIPVELNDADAAAFRNIPGITPLLAYQIVHYRDKLEGFVQPEQLLQVPGISDSLFTAIKPYVFITPQQMPKLNLNTASPFALLHHPFIPEKVAKAILILRQQKGHFQSVNDLQAIPFLSAEQMQQIKQFCSTQ
ncbi:MAG: helix-hairpin-helix domain-containing protein [Bacteroidota bacterium]|nr:helix-hairpin-helix domain-containing protein [Bacteroidota bacterium]